LSLDSFLELLRRDPALAPNVTAWRTTPASPGSFLPFPDEVPERMRKVLEARGITRLWSHQALACSHATAGRSTLLVTPTASGKSLGYNLPVLSHLLRARSSGATTPTALYLFPTKALSQDQVAELHDLSDALDGEVRSHTYDGDTPPDERRITRERCDVLITNPYMLHVGILPNHARWVQFFRRLRYVVIDELHVYRGIFGSSVANVLRRLDRIARHHGGDPVFIACSATIRDPAGHFERLTGRKPVLVDRSGAPAAERHHVFYNPPLVNPSMGIRARAVDHVRTIARRLLERGIPSIVFGRSRSSVEVVTKYLHDLRAELGIPAERIASYRGGYLPLLRREIERGLRRGAVQMVAATNALELGVDIGSLDAAVMLGYPGSISSYLQQAGRAGRRSGQSVSVLVGTSLPLDQYVMANPDALVHGGGETHVINPDNLVLLARHMKCAAFELPFSKGEGFGGSAHASEILDFLAGEAGVLFQKDDRFHWMAEAYPAQEVSLDFVDQDSFVVLDAETGDSLGVVDRQAAPTTIHEDAIYQHQGAQYHVEKLDWDGRRAYARRAAVDYYTDAEVETEVRVLTEDARARRGVAIEGFGDVHVTTLATMFKRIRFYTHENLDAGKIALPPEEMDTTAFWIVLPEDLVAALRLREGTRAGALPGVATLLKGLAPLYLRCSPRDLRAKSEMLHAHFGLPAIILHESVPQGIGLSEVMFERRVDLYRAAEERVRRCDCWMGCPACIGLNRGGREAKDAAIDLVAALGRGLPASLPAAPEGGVAAASA
jgi:DEAD/DEAH box helicase domain-containing protein